MLFFDRRYLLINFKGSFHFLFQHIIIFHQVKNENVSFGFCSYHHISPPRISIPSPLFASPLLSLVAGRRDGDAAVDEQRHRHQKRLDGRRAALLHRGRARAGGDQNGQRACGLRQAAKEGADAQQTDLGEKRRKNGGLGKGLRY